MSTADEDITEGRDGYVEEGVDRRAAKVRRRDVLAIPADLGDEPIDDVRGERSTTEIERSVIETNGQDRLRRGIGRHHLSGEETHRVAGAHAPPVVSIRREREQEHAARLGWCGE